MDIDNWTKLNSTPDRSDHRYTTSLSVLEKGYLYNNVIWGEYDPLTDFWANKSILYNRTDDYFIGTSFSIGSKAYLVFKKDSYDNVCEVWEYNSDTDQWKRFADLPNKDSSPYYWALGVTINNKGYILFKDVIYEFDPTK